VARGLLAFILPERVSELVGGVTFGLLVWPMRRLATRIADRVVYGGRATPYEVLTTFSERAGETYATDDVLPRMAEVLARGVGASRARIWLHVGGELRTAAAWPESDPRDGSLAMPGDTLPDLSPDHAVAVRDRGELLGALSVQMPANDPMTPGRERLVGDLASQAGLLLRNVRLTEELKANLDELRASRQRLVVAQDEERRRLERNIHDGAQQHLVALSIKLGLLGQQAGRGPERTDQLLSQLQSDARDALENLRDLARGIYPPLLADQGLLAALAAQARKSPVEATVEADGFGRYPQDVEATVYFCVLEALQNVAKHARAAHAQVHLSHSDGVVAFQVIDDGVGFDATHASYGTGMQGMADRLAVAGGTLTVRSSPGSGTTVIGRVPAAGG